MTSPNPIPTSSSSSTSSTPTENVTTSSPISAMVRWVSDSLLPNSPQARENALRGKLLEALKVSTMFTKCSDAQREKIAQAMKIIEFKRGDILQLQGEPQERALVIVEGSYTRQRVDGDQTHIVAPQGQKGSGATVGMLHLIRRDRSFATLKCTSDGIAFELKSDDFASIIRADPDLATSIIVSLSSEVRAQTAVYARQTPLFLQKGKELSSEPLPLFAVTCAAAVESFYRSGMNAMINSVLTGQPRAALFPNMHIQMPVRIVYINGFKGIRYAIEKNVDLDTLAYPQVAGAVLATLPGLIMSPVSSMLEASNAGHMNPEPLSTRWTRGFAPRCLREVIFGVGINQLSDYYEERIERFTSGNQTISNLGGSFVAGLVAGYFSHVPHSLSALKLLNPNKSYRELFKQYSSVWEQRVPPSTNRFRPYLVSALACIFPKGCLVRSAQISGSFIIINSAINALKHVRVEIKRMDSS
jgi:CRP-like cAMP-binding protein